MFTRAYASRLLAVLAWSAVACFQLVMAEPLTESEAVDIEVFTREGCRRCSAARAFLTDLARERPHLRIRYQEIDRDDAAVARLRELSARAHVQTPAVPSIWLREQLVVGFDDRTTTGRAIVSLLDGRDAHGGVDAGPACAAEAGTSCEEAEEDAVNTGWFGTLRASRLGLPFFTITVGLLDGFNPCAMWVLLFLLSLLVNLQSRMKMALIAGTFVAVSGLVYFAFMAAWLNVFLLIGVSRLVQTVLGLIALVVGVINVKDFIALKKGPSLSIPEAAKPGIYQRVRGILRAESLPASLVGVVVLALLVNAVELLCTAGFPAVYTSILARQGLSTPRYYAYLGLYNLAYIVDDTLMVTLAVWTLSKRKLTERAGRWLKLMSGAVMVVLALGLLFFPELLR